MKILVACEESQTVTIELRKRGYEAYSLKTKDKLKFSEVMAAISFTGIVLVLGVLVIYNLIKL